eukprot:gene538-8050_t
MGLLWAFQPLSLAITALIPIFLFPLVGIQAGVDVARTYSSNVSVIILRGFIMSLAMERWNLHKRIALNVMLKAGKNLGLIIAGFMFVASFLSMWASNTPPQCLRRTNLRNKNWEYLNEEELKHLLRLVENICDEDYAKELIAEILNDVDHEEFGWCEFISKK